ncbi:diguanylate cyclase [Planomonospora sp. ID91781]|uniref:diguanylate cyclase n=1 Tax=Planomonospora sp. ID91781 TaxID=2738135 RepID=UPI0018C426AD|nr:diguanylate cyclase [Planomonospora sp. ID91781]MBG0823100.1 diguanylate cyclase [Planomonospora sp. ID91781]
MTWLSSASNGVTVPTAATRSMAAFWHGLGLDAEPVAELGRGAHTAVYRIRRDGVDYALKVLQGSPADRERMAAAFSREAALLARVDHPGVPKVFDAGIAAGYPYLVQELLEGRTLTALLEDAALPEDRVVALAADGAAALAAAHRAGLVHRDIKPDNIVITGEGRARLVDFGLAAAGDRVLTGDAAVGTFHYSAPEQTGMLNRPVDRRADLYAFGVVLFQAATGVLPFVSGNVGELIAMHANLPAPDPRSLRPELSSGFAEMIRRLLAKDPDDRFATADELLTVLARLAPEVVPPTPHAAARSALAGRSAEQAALAARWARARAGTGGVVLLSGAPGSGKTSLARELAAAARAGGALVMSGKCDPDSSLPLAALRAAVEERLGAIAALAPEARAAAVDRLRTAAGAGASLLRSLSPLLGVLLDAPELDAEGRHEQFAGAVALFLAALPGETGGLLILDDVQWLDGSSLAVLRRLAEELADVPLLVVATARDDEASRAGGERFDDALGATVDLRIPVGPLDDAGTAALISSYLAGSTVGPEVIAELSARGRGNPFTILEYLHSLVDAGALRPHWGAWRLDTDLLREIDLPADVLDLVIARIDGVGEHVRSVLAVAAAIGTVVPTGLLAEVIGAEPAVALAEAAEHGLVQPHADGYAFVHDRIREALLAAVDADRLRALHQRIATVLDSAEHTGPAAVYATARHYGAGETDRNPERVFATGWAAGRLALAENAPDTALAFLETAQDAAERAGIEPDSRFRETFGVAYWSTGRIEPARRQLEAGLDRETDPVRRAALLLQLAHVLRTSWELSRSIACGRQGLAELGVPVPENPVLLGLSTARIMLRWLARGTRAPAASPATGETAERLLLRLMLIRAVASAASLGLKNNLVVAFTLQAEPFAHRLGATSGFAEHLSMIGTVAGPLRLGRRRDRIYRQAKELATALGDPKAYGYAVWFEAFSKLLGGESLIGEWADVSETQRRWLEVDYYTNILLIRCRNLVQRGYAADALTWHDQGRSRISQATADTFPSFGIVAGMSRALLGETGDDASAFAARCAEPLDAGHAVQFILGATQISLEQDELGEPFEQAAAAFDRLALPISAIFVEYRMIYAYLAYGRLTQLQRATDPADRRERLAAAEAAVRALERAAAKTGPGAGPLMLALLRGYATVAAASLLQLRGRPEEALARLARDGVDLVRLDAPLVEYEAARVRSRALAALGDDVLAGRQANAALALAAEHRWARRARWVRSEFGPVLAGSRGTVGTGYAGHAPTSATDPHRRRLEALQQVSTAAAKVLDPRQLARVALDETLRILGAERAMLFLADEPDGRLRPDLGRDAGGADLSELTGYSSTLVDRVAADRRPVVVTGSEEGAALGSQSAVVYGLRSIVVAPLELEERLIGVVYLDSRVAKGVFTDADIDILTAVTSHIAVSLETARAAQLELAVQVANEQRDTAELLRGSMTELSATFDPGRVLEKLLDVLARTLPADRLHLLHRDGSQVTALHRGAGRGTAADPSALLTAMPAGHGDLRSAPAAVATLLDGAAGWLAVPIRTHGHGDGLLIAGSADPDGFTQTHRDVTAAIVGQGSAAYDSARLFTRVQQLATTDGLTGAYNRRHFATLAAPQVEIAKRNCRPLAAMMVDIDHFKRINDTYGHATGDEVIRAVAQVLRGHLREPDVFCRYGGEEFAAVLSEVHGDPLEIGERLRAAVAGLGVPADGDRVRFTVSIGISELKIDDTLDSLLDRADQALYQAKRSGRNRVQPG